MNKLLVKIGKRERRIENKKEGIKVYLFFLKTKLEIIYVESATSTQDHPSKCIVSEGNYRRSHFGKP